VLSRIAESLYWMGRYVERAENTARMLQVNYFALMEAPLVAGAPGLVTEQWAPLLAATAAQEEFHLYHERADAQTVPYWLAMDRRNPGSIHASLAAARANARALRDRISSEMWQTINTAFLRLVADSSVDLQDEELHDYCADVRDTSQLFFGISDATMPRDLGWTFMRAGQYLERADSTVRTLMVRFRQAQGATFVAEGVETHRAASLLRSLSAYEAFLKSHHRGFDAREIASFLLCDPTFPRSVLFCAHALDHTVCELARHHPEVGPEICRQAGWLAARLRYMPDASPILDDEDPSLEDLLGELAQLSDGIGAAYFGHTD